MKEIMVSVYIVAYNHEKYIGRAIDSVMMQKTEYTYEVLIGDDCSPDGTRDVLREYEKKYPGKLQVIYREKNLHGQRPNNAGDLKLRCKGKYFIGLEGDDYWLDENKIQKQVEYMEKHPEYLAVTHNCIVVDENSQPNGESYPECKDEEYTIQHFVSEIMPGQLTTMMVRNYYRDNVIDLSLFEQNVKPGDRVAFFALITCGRIHCVQEVMSAYRHVKKSGTSFSATQKYNFIEANRCYKAMIEYSKKMDNKKSEKYAELMYFRNLMNGYMAKQCSVKDIFVYLKNIKHKLRTVFLYVKYYINHHILKKKMWV